MTGLVTRLWNMSRGCWTNWHQRNRNRLTTSAGDGPAIVLSGDNLNYRQSLNDRITFEGRPRYRVRRLAVFSEHGPRRAVGPGMAREARFDTSMLPNKSCPNDDWHDRARWWLEWISRKGWESRNETGIKTNVRRRALRP